MLRVSLSWSGLCSAIYYLREKRVNKVIRLLLWCVLFILPIKGFAFTQPCERVAQVAGEDYEVRPNWFASLAAPVRVLKGGSGFLVERNGAWYIYEMPVSPFEKEGCIAKSWNAGGEQIEIVPVLYNRVLGKSAVINGRFVIKVYRVRHLNQLVKRYGFNKVSVLPNRFTAIFDVRPQNSYDLMIEQLDRDRDVEWVAPVLSEPN